MVKCPECSGENKDSAKFCKQCGASLKPQTVTHAPQKSKDNNNTKLIVAAVVVIAVVLAGVGVYASGILNGVPLENQDFEYFTMDVPKESAFELDGDPIVNDNFTAVTYENNGKYSTEVARMAFGKGIDDLFDEFKPDETDGDLKIYKNGDKEFGVLAKNDGCEIFITGSDLNTMKSMAKTFKNGDLSKLTDNSTAQASQTTQTAASTKTSSSMTINGGSFSTGGGLSDKTYARIFVGSQHAGENVKIQILYSRDGSSLNSGNMVPKTVGSDGYIEVASADSYKYFPDFAKINLYDSSGKLLDTQSVSLSPEKGTQNF